MEPPIIVTCALLILGLAPKVSGTAISMDELAELRVMPTILSTTQCYGSYFYKELCSGDTTIEITDAVYGVSPCNADGNIWHCCPNLGDCTIPVEEANPHDHPDYYNEILVSCNNKQTCGYHRAQWISSIYQWCTGVSGMTTDYVTLHYMCLTEADRLTTTLIAATDLTISANSTTTSKPSPGLSVAPATVTVVSTVTDDIDGDDGDDGGGDDRGGDGGGGDDGDDDDGGGGDDGDGDYDDGGDDADGDEDIDPTQTIVIIAVIVVVVVAVVVAVTVWMVCRKRKADNRSEENKTAAAQSAPGMMTSHVSACVDDVDPYHTARPGGGPGPQGPSPAQGLNDVTKPATNPYDTCQPLTKPMVTKKPKPNPKAVDEPNMGADLYTEVVNVRPRKTVVLDKSPGEEDVEANNNGSDMTEAGNRASYDLVMQENHEYGTRQGLGGDGEGEGRGVDGEGEGEEHGVHAEGHPHEGRQDGDQDIPTDPDYDLVMTENNVYN